MADNYLEKQYAEYESKKAAWLKACKLGIEPKKKGVNKASKPEKKGNQAVPKENPTQLKSDK